MNMAQAKLELALWQANADMENSSDLYLRLTAMGLPPEVAIRLKDLIGYVKSIQGKVISMGKIILLKVLEFIELHPKLATGIALGAVLSTLVASVPFLGPILAPIALPLGITLGAIAGHRMDVAADGKLNGDSSITSVTQDLIEIVHSFFKLLIDTLIAVSAEFKH